MARRQLAQTLKEFDLAKIEKVFGQEAKLKISPVNLAPVKRVAIFAEAFVPKVDGVSKSAYLTLRYLQATGREVMVFAPDIAPNQIGSSKIIPLPSLGLPFAPETRMALPSLLIDYQINRFNPDLIHLFSPALMSISGVHIGRRRRIPVIANYQTDLPGYAKQYGFPIISPTLNNWLRYIHNHSHLTLVASNKIMSELHEQGYHRLRLWQRGVDLNRFNPQHRSQAMRDYLLNGRDPNSLLVVYVGRLAVEKRVDLLLDIAKLSGVALTIIGDGAARDQLERLFEGTGTFFTGYLYDENLAKAYASADVFAFSGPNETFGQVVQEAMSSGLPTVIINQGGIVDLVTDGFNGFICPDDPMAFARAIALLRDHPELRHKMACVSRQLAEQRPWETIMAQLEDYYTEAVHMNERFNRLFHAREIGWLQTGS